MSGPGPRRRLLRAVSSVLVPSALELAATGPALGTRHRWLSPAGVLPAHGDIWAVHTPHIGGVVQRYRAEGSALVAQPVATGLTNHRPGARDLDVSARVGPWLVLPRQDWRRAAVVDTTTASVLDAVAPGAPIVQCVAAATRDRALLLTESRVAIWAP